MSDEVKLPPIEDTFGMGAVPVADALRQRNEQLRESLAQIATLTAQVAKFKVKRDRTGLLISGLKRRLFAALDVERILAIGLREVDHASEISRSVLHDVLDCAAVQHARAEKAEAELATLTEERDRSREARRNHAETLRGIAKMDPAKDAERMRQWARDGLSGYVATYEMTLREFEQRVEKAEAELAALKEEWREHLAEINDNAASGKSWAEEVTVPRLEKELAALREGARVTYRVDQDFLGDVIRGNPAPLERATEYYRTCAASGDRARLVEVTTITRERILDATAELTPL